MLNNLIRQNTIQTYGDILEGKKPNNDTTIQQMCTSEEYDEYIELKNKDRIRLLESTQNNLEDKSIQNNKIPGLNHHKTVTVCGIGEVQQIC